MKENKLSIFLAVLLVASIIYIFKLRVDLSADDEAAGITSITSMIDPDLLAHWRDPARTEIDPNRTGSFIDYPKAVINAYKYRDQRGRETVLNKEPYGFAFGRKQLRRLLNQIDYLNNNLTFANPKDSIQGVRIYFVRNQTMVGGNQKEHFDVMLIPVKGTGLNYIPIGDQNAGDSILAELRNKGLLGDDLFLNTSAPCPDLCE